MNCKKFTPGPWEVVGHQIEAVGEFQDRRCTGYGCNNNFVCDLDDGEYHEYDDEEECAANAHLIAAAPEMYRELDKLKNLFITFSYRLLQVKENKNAEQWMKKAMEIEKLLKKARGEE